MATIKQYAYQIKGEQVSIFERDFSPVQDGQTLTAPDIDLPAGGGTWKSPITTVDEGLEIECVYSPGVLLLDENDSLDLPLYLSKALIYYVKAKLAEDAMNIEAKEYLMKQFKTMIEKHNSGKIWGSRQIISGSGAIR